MKTRKTTANTFFTRSAFVLGAAVLLSVFCAQPGYATEIRFQEGVVNGPAPGTFIRADNATGNFDTHAQVIVGSNSWGTGNAGPLRGLLAFDLSALSALNPASIDSVELVMHTDPSNAGALQGRTDLTIDLWTTNAFVETAATWNVPGPAGGALNSLLTDTGAFDPTVKNVDVTFSDTAAFRTAVSNALGGSNQLYLLQKDQNEASTGVNQSFARFSSEDVTTAANHPELIVKRGIHLTQVASTSCGFHRQVAGTVQTPSQQPAA